MLLSSPVYRQVSSRVSSHWTWGQRQGGRSVLPRAIAAQPRSLQRSRGPAGLRRAPRPPRPGTGVGDSSATPREDGVPGAGRCLPPKKRDWGTRSAPAGECGGGVTKTVVSPRLPHAVRGRRGGAASVRDQPRPRGAPPGTSRGEPWQPRPVTASGVPAAAGGSPRGGWTTLGKPWRGGGTRETATSQQHRFTARRRAAGSASGAELPRSRRGGGGRAGGPSRVPGRGAVRARGRRSALPLGRSLRDSAAAPRPCTAARYFPALLALPARGSAQHLAAALLPSRAPAAGRSAGAPSPPALPAARPLLPGPPPFYFCGS